MHAEIAACFTKTPAIVSGFFYACSGPIAGPENINFLFSKNTSEKF
jgi:hypothetical protein